MSMELLVFLSMDAAPNVQKWNAALAERKLPVKITETVNLTEHSGFLPMTLDGNPTGLYFLNEDYSELAASIPSLTKPPFANTVVYSLGYGGDFKEGAVVFFAAAALVEEFRGVAFETQAGQFMGAPELVEAAKQLQALAEE